MRRLAWLFALCAIAFVSALLVWEVRYAPPIGLDESAAWLGWRLIHDHSFGMDIDPVGALGFSRAVVMDCYPPVYYAVTGAIFALAGFGIEQARWATVLFMALTALAAYGIAQRLAGIGAGLIALGGYLMVPALLRLPYNRPDIAVPFFLLVAIWLLSEKSDRLGRSRLLAALSGLSYALAVLSHFVALIAGPVLAVALWYRAGLRFWRSQLFWAFTATWAVAILLYVALLHPYEAATLRALLDYGTVATGAEHPFTGAIARHWSALWFAAGWAPQLILTFVFVPLAVFLSPLRRWFTETQAFWLPLPAALAAMMTLYPNIAVYGYYAPVYIVPSVVSFAVCAAVLLRPVRWAAPIAGLCLVAVLANTLASNVRERVERVQYVPVTAALDFFDGLGFSADKPILGLAHWVFAKSARGLQGITGLRPDPRTGRIDFPDVLQRTTPKYRNLSEAQGLVVDAGIDNRLIQRVLERKLIQDFLSASELHLPARLRSRITDVVLGERPELKAADDRALAMAYVQLSVDYRDVIDQLNLTERAVFFHPLYRSAQSTAFARTALKPSYGVATPSGPASFTPSCRRAFSPDTNLQAVAPGLFSRRFRLTLPGDGVALLRIGMSEGSGFAAVFERLSDADAAVTSVQSGAAPYALASGLTRFRLPDGGHGRDFLLPIKAIHDAVLVVFGTTPERVNRIEIGLSGPCTPPLEQSLDTVVAGLASGEPLSFLRVPVPALVTAGRPFALSMRSPATGFIQLWQRGRLLKREPFANQTELPITIPLAGDAGVEIWIEHPGAPATLGWFRVMHAR
jgi:hypothetical protein